MFYNDQPPPSPPRWVSSETFCQAMSCPAHTRSPSEGVIFSISLSFSSLSLCVAQADGKCQISWGYFRPNWQIIVPRETQPCNMPSSSLLPKKQTRANKKVLWTFLTNHNGRNEMNGCQGPFKKHLVPASFICSSSRCSVSINEALETLKRPEYPWMDMKSRGISSS